MIFTINLIPLKKAVLSYLESQDYLPGFFHRISEKGKILKVLMLNVFPILYSDFLQAFYKYFLT